MPKNTNLNIPVDLEGFTPEDYRDLWDHLGPLEVKMIEKCGKCQHEVGDMFIYKNPYDKPAELCNALKHVFDLYTWRIALGFPSWETDDRKVHRIHCPAKKGTIWEMRKKEQLNSNSKP